MCIRDSLHPAAMEALADAMMEVQKTDSQKPDLEREALERELRDVQRLSLIHILPGRPWKATRFT